MSVQQSAVEESFSETEIRADEREQVARWVEISIPVTRDGYARIEEVVQVIRNPGSS